MIDQIEQYIACVYEPDDWAEVRTLRRSEAKKFWYPAGSLFQQVEQLRALNTDGWNIYVGPNPRRSQGQSGDDAVKLCRCLFADFDDVAGSAVISPADIVSAQIEEKQLPKPTLLINSGHGIHAYWRLISPLGPKKWRLLQQRLNLTIGSDPAIKNPERLMRLPGFKNAKVEPVDCSIVYAEPGLVYELADIVTHLSRLPKPKPVPAGTTTGERPGPMEHRARAMKYASKWPSVAEGKGRNNAAFTHACQLRRDFDLPDAEAWEILSQWNISNSPPLDERELRLAFEGAEKYGKRPAGNKLTLSNRIARPVGSRGLSEYREYNRRIATGELCCLPLPWSVTSQMTQMGRPTWLVVLAGLKGAAKTFFELQIFKYWLKKDIPVAAYMLEGDEKEIKDRLLAQESGNGDVTSLEWKTSNKEEMEKLTDMHEKFLKKVDENVVVSGGLGLESLEDIAFWIESQAKAGKRAIFVDPISAAVRKGNPWASDPAFIRRAKRSARDYECTVILVTHLIKGAVEGKVDQVAGSKAYGDFSDCLLQLIFHDSEKTSLVKTSLGRSEYDHTHTLFIEKTRAPGSRRRIALSLTEGLVFEEHGIILKNR